MRQEKVQEAYNYCRQIAQRSSKTFYWGSIFLPPPKRYAIWAIYALCRMVDDLVDEAVAPDNPRFGHLSGAINPRQELQSWRNALMRLYETGECDERNLVLVAWKDMIAHYPVPLKPALELLDGVKMDLTLKRYQCFDELYLYCYRVAGTVGLLTSPVFGYEDDSALQYAVDLGVALQLTNILRDIGEDARRDRIYLPLDELKRFGYSEGELMNGIINDAFCELVRFQISRADTYYQRSQRGVSLLSSDCRLAVNLSGTLYRRILERIRVNNYNVFTKRASVPLKTKLAAASQYWLLEKYEAVKGLYGV